MRRNRSDFGGGVWRSLVARLRMSVPQIDEVVVASAKRRILVIALFGGPVVVTGVMLSVGHVLPTTAVTAMTALAALIVGVSVAKLEAPLRPARGRWLDAAEQAIRAIVECRPEEGVPKALATMRHVAGRGAVSTELWWFSPARCYSVDTAGYLRSPPGALPAWLIRQVEQAREATLSADDVGATLQCTNKIQELAKRPDLRPIVQWYEERSILAISAIVVDGALEGVVVLPRGERDEPVTLEESRAFRRLADAFGGAMQSIARCARSEEREKVMQRRMETARDHLDKVDRFVEWDGERHIANAEFLAESANAGVYSPAMRIAVEQLQHRVRIDAPVALIAALGVSPVAHIAQAHLKGPRRRAPLIVVDCAAHRYQDELCWSSATKSPLQLAHRGTLVLLIPSSLPASVQIYITDALSTRRAPHAQSDPLDVALIVVLPAAPEGASSFLHERLAARLRDALAAPVVLPPLGARAEDLRSIILAMIAQEAIHHRGAPLGIEPTALAYLVNYEAASEPELRGIVVRLVNRAIAPRISFADVLAVAGHANSGESRDCREQPLSVDFSA